MVLPSIHVSAVVFRDEQDKVLTVRKHGTSKFMFPGGKPEPGESAVETAIREGEYYLRQVEHLVSTGAIKKSQALRFSDLGLLRDAEMDKRIGELSMGKQRRLELALVLARLPHVLILDEPTNHLFIELVDELTQGLEDTNAAVVLSSHDRQLLRDTKQWPRIELF